MTKYTSFVAVDSAPSGPAVCGAKENNSKAYRSEGISPDQSSSDFGRAGEAQPSGSAPIQKPLGLFIMIIVLFS